MATSPVSSSDLRLERMRGQPPDTAVMSFDSGRSISWVMARCGLREEIDQQ